AAESAATESAAAESAAVEAATSSVPTKRAGTERMRARHARPLRYARTTDVDPGTIDRRPTMNARSAELRPGRAMDSGSVHRPDPNMRRRRVPTRRVDTRRYVHTRRRMDPRRYVHTRRRMDPRRIPLPTDHRVVAGHDVHVRRRHNGHGRPRRHMHRWRGRNS